MYDLQLVLEIRKGWRGEPVISLAQLVGSLIAGAGFITRQDDVGNEAILINKVALPASYAYP
jgi:hypothetical protein